MAKTPKSDESRAAVEELRASGYRGPVDEQGRATTHAEWCERHGIDPQTGRPKS